MWPSWCPLAACSAQPLQKLRGRPHPAGQEGVPGRSTAGQLARAHLSPSQPIQAVIATLATSLLLSARLLPAAALLKALHGKLLMHLSVPFSDYCPLIGASRVLLLAT